MVYSNLFRLYTYFLVYKMPVCSAVVNGIACGAAFQTKMELTLHVVEIHEHVMCDYVDCHHHYSDLRTLRDHVDTSHEKLRSVCNVCEREFPTRNQFYTHRRKVAACVAATRTLVQYEAPAPREFQVAVQVGEHYTDLAHIPIIASAVHRGAVLASVAHQGRMVNATVTRGGPSVRRRRVGVPALRRRVPVVAVSHIEDTEGSTEDVDIPMVAVGSTRSVASNDSSAVTSTVVSGINPPGPFEILVHVPGSDVPQTIRVETLADLPVVTDTDVTDFLLGDGANGGLVSNVQRNEADGEAPGNPEPVIVEESEVVPMVEDVVQSEDVPKDDVDEETEVVSVDLDGMCVFGMRVLCM